MINYGNWGGWKAIRTINRDARINDGLSPYGYKARYSAQPSQRSIRSWHFVSTGNLEAAQKIYVEFDVYLDADQTEEWENLYDICAENTRSAEIHWDEFENSIIFRKAKYNSWIRKWPPTMISDSERLLSFCEKISQKLKNRHAKYMRFEKNFYNFQNSFDHIIFNLLNDYFLIEDLENSYSHVDDIITSRLTFSKDGKAFVLGWEGLKESCNFIQKTILESYEAYLKRNMRPLVELGAMVILDKEKGVLHYEGTERFLPPLTD